jgi:hypothetical protein
MVAAVMVQTGALSPILLANRIEETNQALDGLIARWGSAAEDLACIHARFSEQTARATRLSRGRLHEALDDREIAAQAASETEVWRNIRADLDLRIAGVRKIAADQHVQSRRQLSHCQMTLRRLTELRIEAQEAVEKAHDDLTETEEKLERAREILEAAERELSEAEDRTEVVGQDSEGHDIHQSVDTTPYVAAVARAGEWEDECEEARDKADEELEEAVEALEKAVAKELACERAVEHAEEACRLCNDCDAVVSATADAGSRFEEEVQRLSAISDSIRSHAEVGHDAAERAVACATMAEQSADAAGNRLRHGSLTLQEATSSHHQYRPEIDQRLQALRQFDSP